ncbi:hypothetical protein K7432_003582 [Basidiobolus ranarum]|uniref:Tyrosinase copper-binding domain-containing protein n=1 Tax=Basidiobolus ranarum TaxID=34480 RepID=A0ABR2WZL0_9FUNG
MKTILPCISLIAIGLIGGVLGQAGRCSQIRVRKEIRQMTDNERNAFFRAIIELKKRNIYETFAFTHSNYEVYAHGTPDFFPWHRQFLLTFENALRKIDPSVNLPYWDWTIDSQAPEKSIIFQWYGGNGQGREKCVRNGVFAGWTLSYPNRHCLKRSFDEGNRIGSFYSAEVINAIIETNDDYDEFRQAFESGPHGQVHNGISGDMKQMISPNDPIFWLHHGFVDKIYNDWQLRGPGFVNRYNGIHGYDERPAGPRYSFTPFNTTAQSVFDTRAFPLCYQYARTPSSEIKAPVPINNKVVSGRPFGNDPQSVLVKRAISTPVKNVKSTPVKNVKSTPVKRVKSTPVKRVKSTPVKHTTGRTGRRSWRRLAKRGYYSESEGDKIFDDFKILNQTAEIFTTTERDATIGPLSKNNNKVDVTYGSKSKLRLTTYYKSTHRKPSLPPPAELIEPIDYTKKYKVPDTNDRSNLDKLRIPKGLAYDYVTVNHLNLTYVRQQEATIAEYIDKINAVPNYASPVCLGNADKFLERLYTRKPTPPKPKPAPPKPKPAPPKPKPAPPKPKPAPPKPKPVIHQPEEEPDDGELFVSDTVYRSQYDVSNLDFD